MDLDDEHNAILNNILQKYYPTVGPIIAGGVAGAVKHVAATHLIKKITNIFEAQAKYLCFFLYKVHKEKYFNENIKRTTPSVTARMEL